MKQLDDTIHHCTATLLSFLGVRQRTAIHHDNYDRPLSFPLKNSHPSGGNFIISALLPQFRFSAQLSRHRHRHATIDSVIVDDRLTTECFSFMTKRRIHWQIDTSCRNIRLL